MEVQSALDVIFSYLPPRLRLPLERSRLLYENQLHEITLRSDRPVCIYQDHHMLFLSTSGEVTEAIPHDPLTVSVQDVRDTLLKLCDYSFYARCDEIRHGYLTIRQGIRVGLCGTAVHTESSVSGLKHISTLSFRIPREVKGCADEVLELVAPNSGVLVCGPPSSGKTTLIRDMARQLSYHYRVVIADGRGELSSPCEGQYGYDVGLADVYVNMPKDQAIVNSVRSLAPDLIICDELGDESDIQAIRYALRCGVSFICTVHASSLADLRVRPATASLLSSGAFGYLVFLDGRDHPGRVRRVCEWRSDHD